MGRCALLSSLFSIREEVASRQCTCLTEGDACRFREVSFVNSERFALDKALALIFIKVERLKSL